MVLRNLRRRLSTLEQFFPPPLTAQVFRARAEEHARRTGMSLEDSIDSLMRALSDDELRRLIDEVEQIMFGGDTAARDAAKREVLMAFDQGALVTGSQERG